MQEQMSGAAMAMPADTNKAFKVYTFGNVSIMVGFDQFLMRCNVCS